jgi:uncharacterized protein YutE (UPF0331/DUF86 family)
LLDGDSIQLRLAHLERLIEQLELIHARGKAALFANEDLQALAERRLQLTEQICIDVGLHLVSELSARPPNDYAEIFKSLADAGHLDRSLAERLSAAAGQRNVLVHLYLDIDYDKIWDALTDLDVFREFAAAVQRILEREAE